MKKRFVSSFNISIISLLALNIVFPIIHYLSTSSISYTINIKFEALLFLLIFIVSLTFKEEL
jgi:hypothetical protein